MKDEMIRDRLVVGIRDSSLSERLQLDSDLTLEKAKKAIRQREAVKEQQRELTVTEANVAEVQSKRLDSRRRTRSSLARGQTASQANIPRPRHPQQQQRNCTRCGKGAHKKDSCPAKDTKCHRCGKTGHFRACCFTKTVAEVSGESIHQEEDVDLDSVFLNAIGDRTQPAQPQQWRISLDLNKVKEQFKIDTGAEVTAISEVVHRRIGSPELAVPKKTLKGPTKNSLEVLGQFKGNLSYNGRSSDHTIFVVKGLRNSLLGLPTITSLSLVKQVDRITEEESSTWMSRYPKVFTGLGTMGEAYEIKLKPNAQPHAIYTPRQVPIPYRSKVKEELYRMEALGRYIKSGKANYLVFGNGSNTQEEWFRTNMRGPPTAEQKCTPRSISHYQGWTTC